MAQTRLDRFFNIINENNYDNVKKFMENEDWKSLCKEQKHGNAFLGRKIAVQYAAKMECFHALNAIIDVMLSDPNFKNPEEEAPLGPVLNELIQCKRFNCAISRAELAKKIIRLKPKEVLADFTYYSLHLCIIHQPHDRELMETVCELDGALDKKSNGVNIPIIYATKTNHFEIVGWIAEKNNAHFTQHAKEIWNIAVGNKNQNALKTACSAPAPFLILIDAISDGIDAKEATRGLFHAVQTKNIAVYGKLLPIVNQSLKYSLSTPFTLTSPEHNNMTLLELGCQNNIDNKNKCVEKIILACEIDSQKNQDGFIAKRNMRNWHLSQALYWAVKNNNYENTNIFLEHGSPFSGNGDGSAEIREAVKDGNLDMVKLLFLYHASPNVMTDITPLIIAIQNRIQATDEKIKRNHEEIIRLLLENKASVNSKDNKESIAMLLAVKNSLIDLAKLLYSKGAVLTTKNNDDNLIYQAVCNQNKDMVSFLLNAGAPVIVNNKEKCPALLVAIRNGDADIVEQILFATGGEAANVYGDDGNLPLVFACDNDNPKMVALLLSYGADPDRTNNKSEIMEAYATRTNKTSCVDAITKWKTDRHDNNLRILTSFQNVTNVKFTMTTKSGYFSKETTTAEYQLKSAMTIDNELRSFNVFDPQSTLRALERIRKSLADEYQANEKIYDAEVLKYLRNLLKLIDDAEKFGICTKNSNSSSASFRDVVDVLQTVQRSSTAAIMSTIPSTSEPQFTSEPINHPTNNIPVPPITTNQLYPSLSSIATVIHPTPATHNGHLYPPVTATAPRIGD